MIFEKKKKDESDIGPGLNVSSSSSSGGEGGGGKIHDLNNEYVSSNSLLPSDSDLRKQAQEWYENNSPNNPIFESDQSEIEPPGENE